jgi:hypothetical protein
MEVHSMTEIRPLHALSSAPAKAAPI